MLSVSYLKNNLSQHQEADVEYPTPYKEADGYLDRENNSKNDEKSGLKEEKNALEESCTSLTFHRGNAPD